MVSRRDVREANTISPLFFAKSKRVGQGGGRITHAHGVPHELQVPSSDFSADAFSAGSVAALFPPPGKSPFPKNETTYAVFPTRVLIL